MRDFRGKLSMLPVYGAALIYFSCQATGCFKEHGAATEPVVLEFDGPPTLSLTANDVKVAVVMGEPVRLRRKVTKATACLYMWPNAMVRDVAAKDGVDTLKFGDRAYPSISKPDTIIMGCVNTRWTTADTVIVYYFTG